MDDDDVDGVVGKYIKDKRQEKDVLLVILCKRTYTRRGKKFLLALAEEGKLIL